MSAIRLVTLLAATLFSLGCGYGSHNYNNMGGGSPNVTQLVPDSQMHGSGDFMLEVDGSGFGTDAVVYWNGMAQASTYGTGNKVTAKIMAGEVMNSGMAQVYVRSGGMNSNTVNFDVQ
jgi:hypothetical protein